MYDANSSSRFSYLTVVWCIGAVLYPSKKRPQDLASLAVCEIKTVKPCIVWLFGFIFELFMYKKKFQKFHFLESKTNSDCLRKLQKWYKSGGFQRGQLGYAVVE